MSRAVTGRLEGLKLQCSRWVQQNDDLCSKLETSLRVFSYLLAGRLEWSRELSELLYSTSNLLSVVHVCVTNPTRLFASCQIDSVGRRIKLCLNLVECVEVFLELFAAKAIGHRARWALILAIELTKFSLNGFLLFVSKAGMGVSTIDRLVTPSLIKEKEPSDPSLTGEPPVPQYTVGSRTNIRIRTIQSAKGASRDWKKPAPAVDTRPTRLNPYQLSAETLYIGKPLIYLTTRFASGTASYKPWLTGFIVDFTSLLLHTYGSQKRPLNDREQSEMRRRTAMLLVYMLRSPFYDDVSEAKLLGLFATITSTVPGSRLLLKPLLDYVPQWQKVYFYNWAK